MITRNTKQELFVDMVLGTLIYAVVLGFFEEYTTILTTWSYSITFFVAVVMQILTFLTLRFKIFIIHQLRNPEKSSSKITVIIGVWLVMFFSKFVFLFVIESIFGSSAEFSGFFGLVVVILTMVLVKQGIERLYEKLS